MAPNMAPTLTEAAPKHTSYLAMLNKQINDSSKQEEQTQNQSKKSSIINSSKDGEIDILSATTSGSETKKATDPLTVSEEDSSAQSPKLINSSSN